MDVAQPPLQFSMVTSRCGWCHCYPCRCARCERCACGGWLVASEGDDTAAIVAQHNATPQHQAWRTRHE